MLKKGQIGLFIIISVIIVIVGVVYFSLSSSDYKLFQDRKNSYEVKEFIDSCVALKSNEAINLLGNTGGWIYPPELVYAKQGEPDVLNKRAQGFDFFNTKLPYWFYYDSTSSSFQTRMPQYDTQNPNSMRSQMQRYIEETIEEECFNYFDMYEDQYDISYEELNVDVVFSNDNIDVTLDMPILIEERNTDSQSYFETFRVEEENKLYVPYYLAKDIVASQSQTYFLENSILGLLGPYQSSNSRDLLPPFYEFKIDYDFEPWRVDKVENLTKNIISAQINEIKFESTSVDQTPEIPDELQTSEFARGSQRLFTRDYLSEYTTAGNRLFDRYKDYNVRPTYLQFFPTTFNLGGSVGNSILFPKPVSILGSFFPTFFTEYTAVYEMNMPILFEIKNVNSINDDFVFKLPIQANIDYNAALGENIDYEVNQDFVDSLDSGESLICNPLQFISQNVSLSLVDPINNGNRDLGDPMAGVSGAMVTFDCNGLETCYVGESEIDETGKTNLSFKLPLNCDGGSIEISKLGYETITIDNINPSLDNNIELGELKMSSEKEFDVEISIRDPSTTHATSGRSMQDDESGFIIITDNDDSENVKFLEINQNNQYNLNISLRPGNYSIESLITSDEEIVIPEKCVEVPSSGLSGLFGGTDCEWIDELTLEAWITAGISYENYEITQEYLLARDKLKISIIDYGRPSTFDDLEEMSSYIGTSKGSFEPRLE